MRPRMVMRIPLNIDEAESEEVLVEEVGGGLFTVVSVPGVSSECSLGDVVCADRVGEDVEFRSVEIAGGNTTLRLLIDDTIIHRLLAQVEELGCRCSQPVPGMVAVNISVDTPIQGVRILIEDYVEQGLISVADGGLDTIA